MSKTVIRREDNLSNKSSFLSFLTNIKSKVNSQRKLEEEKLLDMIKEAHREWKNSESYFNNATDPDLIDYAIYKVEANRTKFRYLIKLAKEKGIQVEL